MGEALAGVGLGLGEPVGVEQQPRQLDVGLGQAGLGLDDGAQLVLRAVEATGVLGGEGGQEAVAEGVEGGTLGVLVDLGAD